MASESGHYHGRRANALLEPRLRFKMFVISLKNRRTLAFRLDFAKPLPVVQFHVPIFAQ